ncbi:hypothetical protein EWM64_g3900 [Hericium alpestre]|uniref:NADP-dependent oxidoreductase domain-containing protein n=1 Tax=Hericium alpestre TaxID=135208 RepID=A0A4Y9ZZ43_9AGAM|nr:hypothetical protein EWM64_g3900 [Hericium alpestre]
MGSMDKEQSFALLDAYFEAGGNFIDVANNYEAGSTIEEEQNGLKCVSKNKTSERFIKEWMESLGVPDYIVLATNVSRYSAARCLHVDTFATKLRIDYIDILYLRWWDWDTSVEDIMDSLHNLFFSGKMLYLVSRLTAARLLSSRLCIQDMPA